MALTDRTTYTQGDLIAVNILLSYDEDTQTWVAHCLELDLVEDGSTRIKALKYLIDAMVAQVVACMEDSKDFIELAPEDYWKEWQSGKAFNPNDELDHTTPQFHVAVREKEQTISSKYPLLRIQDCLKRLRRFGIVAKEKKGSSHVVLEGTKLESRTPAHYIIDCFKQEREINSNLLKALLRRFEIATDDFFAEAIH